MTKRSGSVTRFGNETPTWLVLAGTYWAWLALTWNAVVLPWWLVLPLGAYIVALHGSLQHEAIHGHPTSSPRWNGMLVFAPLALWIPYVRYRVLHQQHHRCARFGDPLADPESFYVSSESWSRTPWLGRALLQINNTLAGRMLLGPLVAIGGLWSAEIKRILRGDHGLLRTWAWHWLAASLVIVWVVYVCEIPIWEYVLLFVWSGLGLTLLRSFTEHRATGVGAQQTAIVEAALPFRLLYLNNNYHLIHHEHPSVPWYELPSIYRRQRRLAASRNGGFVFSGYLDVARRFLLRMKDQPVYAPD